MRTGAGAGRMTVKGRDTGRIWQTDVEEVNVNTQTKKKYYQLNKKMLTIQLIRDILRFAL